jgi:hypothetical protein
VVNFLGIYHALLGWPCFAKFMAIPNYTYLKQAYYYEQDYIDQATALVTPYAPNGPSHNAGRVLVKGVAKAAAVLD